MRKKHTHGGARKGAGKKPMGVPLKATKCHTFASDIIQFLESCLESESAELDHIIRQSRQFKTWAKSRGDGR